LTKYSISVVSHNSGHHLAKLFSDLSERFPLHAELILTINTPEDESYLNNAVGLPLKIIRNPIPLGFGANHNQAFECSSGDRFVVINPDVRIQSEPWHALNSAFESDTSACAPSVLSPTGAIEDSVRRYPTLLRLFRRVVLDIRHPDYIAPDNLSPVEVDWAAGMFLMFDAASFRAIDGFDTRYFMYLEDVDICRRLVATGKKILWVPGCHVVHDAQRASRNSWQHRWWHARSMIRFLF
jgi:N-acetylglucosaminyl-diphospho-decaprenol L-rhamnosyltransferase